MAKSDSEFDTIFNDFITKRSKLGYDSLLSLQQKKFEENKKKLGIKE
jgi:putative aldouronate transport system substrate-binding protein